MATAMYVMVAERDKVYLTFSVKFSSVKSNDSNSQKATRARSDMNAKFAHGRKL